VGKTAEESSGWPNWGKTRGQTKSSSAVEGTAQETKSAQKDISKNFRVMIRLWHKKKLQGEEKKREAKNSAWATVEPPYSAREKKSCKVPEAFREKLKPWAWVKRGISLHQVGGGGKGILLRWGRNENQPSGEYLKKEKNQKPSTPIACFI